MSAAPIVFGNCTLTHHRHICAFFTSAADEYQLLLPFICDGLNHGQRAFHVLPIRHHDQHIARLSEAGVDVNEKRRDRQLEILSPEQTYLRDGRFNTVAMLDTMRNALDEGSALGFPVTRMIAHAECVLDDWSSAQDFIQYEARLNDILPMYDDVVICTYDANMLTTPIAMDVLRTHPIAIIGGLVHINPFFTPPAEFLRELDQRHNPTEAYRA